MKSFVQIMRWVLGILQSWVRRWSAPVVHLDTGRKVRVGRQIAEGGFSFVFEAFDVSGDKKYALKRIRCNDHAEILQGCRREAGVHRAVNHPNLMPLLGMTILDDADCFMLFPFYGHSLRQEVNRRTFDRVDHTSTSHAPWHERVVLQVFLKILHGVQALHAANMTHRDIKLENIMFLHVQSREPVVMDFGSVGPLVQKIDTRRQVLQMTEDASIHTTLPYRPPELFEGGVRAGDADVDYCKVDVWSLGCTLFAMLYGASPFESIFGRSDGRLQIVECTQLNVLKSIPVPPAHTNVASWYSSDLQLLVTEMLTQDRHERPNLSTVVTKVGALIHQQGGHVDRTTSKYAHANDDDEHDDDVGIALMSRRGFV